MADGQGCLLPRHHLHQLEHPGEEGKTYVILPRWLLLKPCRADVSEEALQTGNMCKKPRHRARATSLPASTSPDPPALFVQKVEIIGNGQLPHGEMQDCFNLETTCNSTTDYQDCCDDNSYLCGLDDETALRCLALVSRSAYWKLALVNQRYMRLLRSSMLFRLRRHYGFLEQWICMFTSGSPAWMAFDPKQNTWRNLCQANASEYFDMSDRESLSAGTHLLWFGREGFEFACYKYDFIINSWEKIPAMVTPRSLFASASCGEFAYVAGGFSAGGQAYDVLRSAERYDSWTGTWHELPPMEIPRQKCSGFVMDGKFYVIGGKNSNHEQITSGEEFDIARGTWRTIENMYVPPPVSPLLPPSCPPLVAVADNELYSIESSTNLLKHYNKHSNTWKVLGTIPVRADFRNGWGLAFKALADELFVIGAYPTLTLDQEIVAVFSWKPHPDAPAPNWQLVNSLSAADSGAFLYNCAVMAC